MITRHGKAKVKISYILISAYRIEVHMLFKDTYVHLYLIRGLQVCFQSSVHRYCLCNIFFFKLIRTCWVMMYSVA